MDNIVFSLRLYHQIVGVRFLFRFYSFNRLSTVCFCFSSKIHAFIYDATVLEWWAGMDKECDLTTVGNWYAVTGYGVGLPRLSKWRDKVNKVILQLQEDGKQNSSITL